MPPQFFKDAHTVLNNKFVPRAFSLNLNPKEDKNDQQQSLESIEEASMTPRAISTAPSTGSSSRFFGGNYPAIGAGAKGQGVSNNMVTDDILEDSSIENMENFVKSTAASLNDKHIVEDKRRLSSRAASDDSDDLLITDIREISVDDSNSKVAVFLNPKREEGESQSAEEAQDYQTAETSADLVMEALVKSQKLCGQFKQKLAQAHTKLNAQEEEISNYRKSTESMKEKIKNFKDHLNSLEEKTTELRASQNNDSKNVSSLKLESKSLLGEIESLKNESSSFKKKLDHLKQVKLSSTYEIERSTY